MAFHHREYDVYIILGGPDAAAPWVHSSWSAISIAIAPLFSRLRDQAFVRSDQLGGQPPNMKPIPFGRIGFDPPGAAKWTHLEDGKLLSGKNALFLGTEVWSPSWNACQRNQKAPDVFVSVTNLKLGVDAEADAKLPCTSVLTLAVACELNRDGRAEAQNAAKTIAALLSAPLRLACTRPWGRSEFGGSAFTDAINDIYRVVLFEVHKNKASAALPMLKGDWKAF